MTHNCCGGHPDELAPADEREAYILRRRRAQVSFVDIAAELNISPQRVDQIRIRAMHRLRLEESRLIEEILDAKIRQLSVEHEALLAEAKAAGFDVTKLDQATS